MTGTALILGATGRFGYHAAMAFEAAGWQVNRFVRGRDSLRAMAQTADVVVNGWNPVYTDWAEQVPALTSEVIAAVKGTAATVILPGNVYVFGAQTPAPWGPDSPCQAENPLGRIRRRMEARYRAEGVRTIVLRGGDFLETRASGNWFDRIMIAKLAKGVFTYPGNPKAVHSWAYLPDMARAAVLLAQMRADLPVFSDIPFAGYSLTGQQMADALEEVMGARVRLRRMSWLPIHLAAPVWPLGRCLREMRYLWSVPHTLTAEPLAQLLPDLPQTGLKEALTQAVQGAGLSTISTQTNRWRLAETASS